MPPPKCPGCNTDLSELVSPFLRDRWSEEEGLKWYWRDGLAWWRLCQTCHLQTWPLDKRCSNRWSAPFSPPLTYRDGIKRRGVCGDFWLTQAAPELLRPAGVTSSSSSSSFSALPASLPLVGRTAVEEHTGTDRSRSPRRLLQQSCLKGTCPKQNCSVRFDAGAEARHLISKQLLEERVSF